MRRRELFRSLPDPARHELFVEVFVRGEQPWLCRVLAVSLSGLRILTGSAELGVEGDEFQITLLSPEVPPCTLRARLAWNRGREAGLEITWRRPSARRPASASPRAGCSATILWGSPESPPRA